MPSFVLPSYRKAIINKQFRRKDKVVNHAVKESERVMKEAIDKIIDHGVLTGQFNPPSLNELYMISERFYRHVITEAYDSCQEEKEKQQGKKRLAKFPKGLPKSFEKLDQIFGDKKYWSKIMSRSKKLTDRLRKGYLRKLEIKFKKLIPEIRAGNISPSDAKKYMMESWQSSRSRVEMIFRTETTSYFGKTQTAFFRSDKEIIGFLFDSVRDTARTDICRTRHGMIYRRDHTGKDSIEYNSPACHYNCRSHLIPLANTPENGKLLEDPARDPAKNRSKIAPLMPGWR